MPRGVRRRSPSPCWRSARSSFAGRRQSRIHFPPSLRQVESLADPRSLARGRQYQRDRRVEIVEQRDNRLHAVVRGSLPYDVELRERGGRLAWSCTCPVGESGEFCKHCVAVAVEVTGPEAPPGGRPRRRRQSSTYAVDIAEWRARVHDAFASDGFVDYRAAPAWASDVFDIIDDLQALLADGHAGAVAELAEDAHRAAEAAIGYIDDSDGWLTDIAGRLAGVHMEACMAARPDPVDLARRLADLELTSDIGVFHRAARTYADVLGEAGLAEYRRIVEPKWRRAAKSTDRFRVDHFLATEAMVGVAQASADPDELIAVRAHTLATPDHYLEIAECRAGVGRDDEAVDWARQGLDTFKHRPWQTPPLREFLAAQLRRRGDDAGAEALWWAAFDQEPSLDAYRRAVAESADADERRRQAVESLERRLQGSDEDSRRRAALLGRSPATTLVEILLSEGRTDEAWAAAAEYGCDDRTRMTLGRARERTHPLDAIAIYQTAIDAEIDKKDKRGYRNAVELLARIEKLAIEAGEPARFHDVIGRIRSTHARKVNLMALMDRKGWM